VSDRWRAVSADGEEIVGSQAPGGPRVVRRAVRVEGRDGECHAVTRPVVALCVCDLSQRSPWCDSTHKSIPRKPRSG
jgi:CDGSH-type Zn-finger protein